MHEQWQIASPASEKKCTRLVNTKTGERTLMDWGHDTPGCKICKFCKMCLLGGMYRSYSRECWCNCCCWDPVVVIGKVMILSSNPRALTCFVWGVSFFFDCCGRTSISCQNVGKVLLRRVSVVGAHRVVLRRVEIGTLCIWGAWLDNRTRYDFVRDILYKISFLPRFANCDDFHRGFG